MSEIWTPKDYQEEGLDFLSSTPAAALWWRMGRGKTAVAATHAMEAMDVGLSRRVLVVAPKRVALQTWPSEFNRWEHLSGVRLQVIAGSAQQRAQKAAVNADIHVINWENLEWLRLNSEWWWDTVILDESSKIKAGPSSVRWRGLVELRKSGDIKRMVQLTGTPSPNGLRDVWAPIYLLDRGRRLGRTQEAFLDRWFFRDSAGGLKIRGTPARKDINGRIKDVVHALRSAVTGGEPIYNRIPVDLDTDVMSDYKRLEKEAFLELGSGAEVDAFHAAALTGKLLQFASGGVYLEHPDWEEVHTAKLEALGDLISEAQGDPMIVAYTHRHERERIMKSFPQAVHMDKEGAVVDAWNRGEIPVLVMHPASGGHGLNMQFGGATVVWFSLNWSLDLFEQLNARLHGRPGQRRDVIIHMLIATDTLDEEVDFRLTEKASVQEALMKAAERRRRR